MPKLEVTAEVLNTVANHVYKGEVKNLSIKRYKSGKNAGKIFAEYSLNENTMFTHANLAKRQQVSNLIRKAAEALSVGKRIELLVQKQSATEEIYTHRLEIRGGTA